MQDFQEVTNGIEIGKGEDDPKVVTEIEEGKAEDDLEVAGEIEEGNDDDDPEVEEKKMRMTMAKMEVFQKLKRKM